MLLFLIYRTHLGACFCISDFNFIFSLDSAGAAAVAVQNADISYDYTQKYNNRVILTLVSKLLLYYGTCCYKMRTSCTICLALSFLTLGRD